MELVTLAHVTLNRVGTASRVAFAQHRHVTRFREVPDSEPATLLDAVKAIAEECNEPRDGLANLRLVAGYPFSAPPGKLVFDMQIPNVSYSDPYAVCFTQPVLKIGERYFKLEELK